MLKLYISHFTLLWFLKVLENVVDFKKNIFMKAVFGQNVMFYLPSWYSGWIKAFILVQLMYFSVSKNFINNCGGVK